MKTQCPNPRYFIQVGALRFEFISPKDYPGFWARVWCRLRNRNVSFEVDREHYWSSGCFSLGVCERCGRQEADE